jgi:hypothetical protein
LRELSSSSLIESVISNILFNKYSEKKYSEKISSGKKTFNDVFERACFNQIISYDDNTTISTPQYILNRSYNNYVFNEYSMVTRSNKYAYISANPINVALAPDNGIASFYCGDSAISHNFGSKQYNSLSDPKYVGIDFLAV